MTRRVDTTTVEDILGVSSWHHQDLSWMSSGLCAQVDPELFFAAEGEDEIGKDNGRRSTAAKRVCLGDPDRGVPACPVLNLCREYAVLNPDELHGVWGGTTKSQRSVLRYQRERERRLVQGRRRRYDARRFQDGAA